MAPRVTSVYTPHSLNGFTPTGASGGLILLDVSNVSAEQPSPHVTIVLPCYNEQDHVIDEVQRICKAMDSSGLTYELLAFDDCSTDETLRRLHDAQPDYPQMRVIAFHHNSGSGTIRRIGSQQARGDIVVWTDA